MGGGQWKGQAMDVVFRPPTAADAWAVLGWRYEAPYDIYNADPATAQASAAALLDPANHYFVATGPDGTLVGFCCYGADARVAGGDYGDPDLLDVGLGLRPDLTGGGHGGRFVAAVLAFGRAQLGARRYRLTVAAFNARARRVYERAGFRETGRFRRGGLPDAPEFVLMVEGG